MKRCMKCSSCSKAKKGERNKCKKKYCSGKTACGSSMKQCKRCCNKSCSGCMAKHAEWIGKRALHSLMEEKVKEHLEDKGGDRMDAIAEVIADMVLHKGEERALEERLKDVVHGEEGDSAGFPYVKRS